MNSASLNVCTAEWCDVFGRYTEVVIINKTTTVLGVHCMCSNN